MNNNNYLETFPQYLEQVVKLRTGWEISCVEIVQEIAEQRMWVFFTVKGGLFIHQINLTYESVNSPEAIAKAVSNLVGDTKDSPKEGRMFLI